MDIDETNNGYVVALKCTEDREHKNVMRCTFAVDIEERTRSSHIILPQKEAKDLAKDMIENFSERKRKEFVDEVFP